MADDISPNLLWTPSKKFAQESNISLFLNWLKTNKQLSFNNYEELHNWSTSEIITFWQAIWEYFQVSEETPPPSNILEGNQMPFYNWFPNTTLNYAEQIFRKHTDLYPAIIFKSEQRPITEISWQELSDKVSQVQQQFIAWGVKKGDSIVAYLPNCPEATITFLAANSLGAIWSSCSPDFGINAVIDRFAQIEPKVLIAVDGYSYGGKTYNKSETIQTLQKEITTIENTLFIPYLSHNEEAVTLDHQLENITYWKDLETFTPQALTFTQVEFSHPIWVLYSSGTTGKPKAITHSQGGILLEHYKYMAFHQNVQPGDRCFWYTTTGWMMWNYIQSALLCQGTVILYDGSPAYPAIDSLWQLAEEIKITHLGTSAGYIIANMKEGTSPANKYDLKHLISIGSTGSPLPPEGFEWVYNNIHSNIWLTSMSGGTDICSAFVGGNPLLPVYSSEIQCRALGCKLEAYNESGHAIINEVGEMVISAPMPSMPIYLWGDTHKQKYQNSYFEEFPGVWRHGDWIKITPKGGIIIYGRSDATLNRGGVRIGTSEVYQAIDKIDEITDSIVVCIDQPNGEQFMPLFVVTKNQHPLSESLSKKIKSTIRSEYTPRHVPDAIIQIKEVPYTISGKKTETPVKKVLMGKPIDSSLNKDALKNPAAMEFFIEFAKTLM